MANYVETADDSDLTPSWASASLWNKDMFTGATGGGNFSVTTPIQLTRSAAFITLAGVPNNDAWEDGGTQTIEIDARMGDPDITGKCRIVRLDSAGNIEEAGSFTAFQVLNAGAERTFNPVSPTWGSGDPEACGDRLAFEFEIINNDSHNHTLQLDIRTATAEVVTDISENVANCSAVAVDNLFVLGFI